MNQNAAPQPTSPLPQPQHSARYEKRRHPGIIRAILMIIIIIILLLLSFCSAYAINPTYLRNIMQQITAPIEKIVGPQGEKGGTGAQGDQGISGTRGAQGISGKEGAPGQPSERGVPGLAGASGVSGSTGLSGSDGKAGIQGTAGVLGVTNDTNIIGTISGENLTLGFNGLLPVSRGGTGLGAIPNGAILAGGTGTLSAIIPGTNGQVLSIVGGVPIFANAAAGFADPLTTIGDIIYRSGSGTTRLPVGTNGQILSVVAGIPTYTAPIDGQILGLAGSTISVSGGNSISLASFLDNTDSQNLAFNTVTRQISISGGNSVVVPDTIYSAGSGLQLSANTFSLPGVGIAGTFGSSSQIPVVTVDTQGRVSAITLQTVVAAPIGSVFGRTGVIMAQNGDYTTDQVTEGITNLYYTVPRFDTALASKTTSDLAEGINLYYTNARTDTRVNTLFPSLFDTRLATKTTDDLTEGATNLYFNPSRFTTQFTTKTTDNLAQGTTNKYYATSLFNIDFGLKTSDNLIEGVSNLYSTPARTRAALSATGPISYSSITGDFSIANAAITNAKLANSTIALALGTTGADANVSGSPAALGGTLTFNIPDASATARGLVTIGAQTFAGSKIFANNLTITGTTALNDNTTIAASKSLTLGSDTSELRFNNTAGTFYVGFKSPATITANRIWTLPAADGTANQVLTTDGVGTLSFETLGCKPGGTGIENTCLGLLALSTNGNFNANTAVGFQALTANVSGYGNVGIGHKALLANTFGAANTAVGQASLSANTTGNFNLAFGTNALRFNNTGIRNAMLGVFAGFSNTSGSSNIAIGDQAFYSNTAGSRNVSVGVNALYWTATTDENTAVGFYALNNTIGGNNIGLGSGAGSNITSGSFNTTIGPGALVFNPTANRQLNVADIIFGSGLSSSSPSDGRLGIGDNNPGTLLSLKGNGSNPTALLLNPYSTSAGSTGEVRFAELTPNGTNYVGFKSADSLATNRIWTLPAADGTANQVLTTDGAGLLSFQNSGCKPSGIGVNNVCVGVLTLVSNINGHSNTAIGDSSLNANVNGSQNTAVGFQSGFRNIGSGNTVVGAFGMYSNLNGNNNVVFGRSALVSSTNGNQNVAIGYSSLEASTGDVNTALGFDAGNGITTGRNNTAIGAFSDVFNPTANNQLSIANIIFGSNLVGNETTPQGNIGIGDNNPSVLLSLKGNGSNPTTLLLNPYNITAGSTGEIRFGELAANGTNYVGFKSPAIIATNRIWTLPAADGTIGQALTTDGAGLLSFGTPPIASTRLSGLLAANTTNIIDNLNFDQTWNWSTATTQNPLSINANALTTGTGFQVASTNTATTGNLFNITSSSTAAVTNGLARFNFTGAYTGSGVQIDSATQTGSGLSINASALTVGNALRINANPLSGGTALLIANVSSSYTGAGLINIFSSATTGTVQNINADSLTTGRALNISSNSAYAGTGLFNINSGATNGTVQNIDANSLTGGTALKINVNSLNNGSGLTVQSLSTTTTGSLFSVYSPTSVFTNSSMVQFSFPGNYTGGGFWLNTGTTAGTSMWITPNNMTTGTALFIDGNNTPYNGSGLFKIDSAATGGTAQAINVNQITTGRALSIFSVAAYTGTGLFTITSSATTGTVQNIIANSLTSGTGLSVVSTANLTTGSLLTSNYTGSGTTGNILSIQKSGANVFSTDVNGNSLIGAGQALTLGTNTSELRFNNSTGTNYVGFKSPATIAANRIWTLPPADGTKATFLQSNGTGLLSWSNTLDLPIVTPATGDVYLNLKASGITIGSITGDGTGGVLYNTTSDSRLKSNQRATQFTLANLMKIEVKDYTKSGVETSGFIAQQLYGVYPLAVTTGSDERDDQGRLVDPWKVDYSKLTPLLVQSVQDLSKKADAQDVRTRIIENTLVENTADITTLKAMEQTTIVQIESLTNRLDDLTKRVTFLERTPAANSGSILTLDMVRFEGMVVFAKNIAIEGALKVSGDITVGQDTAGQALIAADQKIVRVDYKTPKTALKPIVTATPNGQPLSLWGVVESDASGFTIQLAEPTAVPFIFNWTSLTVAK